LSASSRITVWVDIGVNKYTEFSLDGRIHNIKIGKPTREVWIDNTWYECYFNSKIRVRIDGTFHSISLTGPPPSVDIGRPRPDLCRGRVYALRDGDFEGKTPLFLDNKPQLLIVNHKPHVIKFVEGFKTVTINGHPFRTDFGGFPMVISVQGKKHYVRMTNLPDGHGIERSTAKPLSPRDRSGLEGGSPIPPLSPPAEDQIGLRGQDPLNQLLRSQDPRDQLTSVLPGSVQPHNTATNYHTQAGPPKASPLPMTSTPTQPLPNPHETAPTLELAAAAPEAAPAAAPEAAPAADINDLWAKLQSSGVFSLFGSGGAGVPSATTGGIPGLSAPVPESETPMEVEPAAAPAPIPFSSTPNIINNNRHVRRNSFVGIKEITLKSHHPSLKERQQAVIDSLFGPSDLQCKSCGHRFSKEEMGSYSSHLDWHFRARRRERDNARKAQSRRWYYEKNDWIVSDEIEDDEQDMTEEEIILEQSMEVPTVTVKFCSGDQEQESCPVCMELFSQVYKQGEGDEEGCWLLHNAMRDALGTAYHPECFKDKEAQAKTEILDIQTKVEEMEVEEEKTEVKIELTNGDVEMTDAAVKEITAVDEVKPEPLATSPVKSESPEQTEIKMEPEASVNGDDSSVKMEEPIPAAEAVAVDGTASVKTEEGATEVKTEEGTAEVKTEEEVKIEEEDKNATLNLDAPDSSAQAPVVVPKPKIDIKVSITSAAEQIAEPETPTPAETVEPESEFDREAIVVPKLSPEELAARKPLLASRNLTVYPPSRKDGDMSGLCSIM